MSGYNYYSLKKCRCYQPINKKLIETGSGGEVVPIVVNFKVFSISSEPPQRNATIVLRRPIARPMFTKVGRAHRRDTASPFGTNSIKFKFNQHAKCFVMIFFLSLKYNTPIKFNWKKLHAFRGRPLPHPRQEVRIHSRLSRPGVSRHRVQDRRHPRSHQGEAAHEQVRPHCQRQEARNR